MGYLFLCLNEICCSLFGLCTECFTYRAALIVYISVLEQQAKYGDALEVLSGKLGSLILIEVDRLRLQVFSEAFFFFLFSFSLVHYSYFVY